MGAIANTAHRDQSLDEIRSILHPIEELIQCETIDASTLVYRSWCSHGGAATLVRNAQHLVAVIETGPHVGDGPDAKTLKYVGDVVLETLQRWLSFKRRPPASSSSKSRFAWPSSWQSTEVDPDPWDDCEDLAAEDLLEWLVDACSPEYLPPLQRVDWGAAMQPLTNELESTLVAAELPVPACQCGHCLECLLRPYIVGDFPVVNGPCKCFSTIEPEQRNVECTDVETTLVPCHDTWKGAVF